MNAAAMGGSAPGWRPVGRLLLGPWQQRWNRDERWGVWILLVQPLVALGTLWWGPGIAATVFCGFVGGSVLGGWVAVMSNLLEQNQPAAAHLVPGHARALRAALTVAAQVAIAGTAFSVAGMVLALRHTALAPAMAGWPAWWPWAVLTGAAATVLVVTLFVRWPVLGWSSLLIPGVAAWHDGALFAAAGHVLAPAWLAQPLLAAMASLAIAIWLPGALVQHGGPLHARGYARRQAARERFRRRALGLEPAAAEVCGPLDVMGRSRLGAFQWLFQRALARPRGGAGDLMLGLGPAGHWSTLFAKTGTMLVMTTLVVAVLSLFLPADLPLSALNGMSYGMMVLAATPILQMRARYHQSREAQPLLVLAPGVPRGPTLARALALRMTGEFVAGWLLLFALTHGLLALQGLLLSLGLPGRHARIGQHAVDVMAIGVVPLVALAWRRLDRLPPPRQSSVLGDLALGMLSVGGVLAAWRLLHLPLPAIAAAWGLATAAWCAWRWQSMAREPAPLPAGRHRG